MKIFICIFLISTPIFSSEISIHKHNNSYYVEGACDEVESYNSSMEILNERLNSLNSSMSDICTKEITHLFNGFFKQTFMKAPHDVYCYNAPLAFLGAANPLEVSTQEDFDGYILNQDNCTSIQNPRPGDIARVKKHETVHAYIFISNNLVYEKANSGHYPYEFKSRDKALAPYGTWVLKNGKWVLEKIKNHCIGVEPHSSECETKVIFYSCLNKN